MLLKATLRDTNVKYERHYVRTASDFMLGSLKLSITLGLFGVVLCNFTVTGNIITNANRA